MVQSDSSSSSDWRRHCSGMHYANPFDRKHAKKMYKMAKKGMLPPGHVYPHPMPAPMYPAGVPVVTPVYPTGVPPVAYPTGTYVPGTYPPGTYPPGTYPPGTYPPGTYPPGVYPPGHPQYRY